LSEAFEPKAAAYGIEVGLQLAVQFKGTGFDFFIEDDHGLLKDVPGVIRVAAVAENQRLNHIIMLFINGFNGFPVVMRQSIE